MEIENNNENWTGGVIDQHFCENGVDESVTVNSITVIY